MPAAERGAEAGLLELSVSTISASARISFGIGLAHLRDQHRDELHISGSLAPSRWAWRMARRMIRRST